MTDIRQPKRRRSEASRSFDAALGAKMKVFRLRAQMSQTEVGAHLGISFQQVQKYEKGTDRCSAFMLQEMANALAVPITAFFEEVPIPIGASPELREAMKATIAFQKITNSKVRQRILALIEELARVDAEKVEKP